jgi:hypothetical protein
MAGEIGLTKAGQYLDKILTENNPPYKGRLTKFINNFTCRLKRVRPVIIQCDNMDDKSLILNLLRETYMKRFDNEFKQIVDELTYILTRKYIHALTRINFTPTTKTQTDLIRKLTLKSIN